MNTYAYVSGNPLMRVDPFGLTQCDIDAALAISKAFYPKLNFGEGPPKADIPEGGDAGFSSLRNQGTRTNIPGRDGLIHLNKKYLKCLADDEAVDLLDTIIHESLHFTRPPVLQVPPDFDHSYVVPEAARKTDAARESFLKRREGCKCACN